MRFASIACMILTAGLHSSQAWPLVQPYVHEWNISDVRATSQDTPVLAYLYDVNGRPAYKLKCHNGNYSGQSEMNFSGKFQCALFAVKGGKNSSWNLLAATDEQDSDWGNRCRMLGEQLRGECGSWPEYGTHRTFLLRSMKIAFTYKDLQWLGKGTNRHLGVFTFAVQVQPDTNGSTAQAERVKVERPGKACLW